MHQQSHGPVQLLLPLLPLRLSQPHLQLIDATHLGLCAATVFHSFWPLELSDLQSGKTDDFLSGHLLCQKMDEVLTVPEF